MSLAQNCLDNIIGLSRTSCTCYTTGMPTAISKSDLYLDELEGINLKLADSIEDCEEGSVWDIMDKSRDNAIAQTKIDIIQGLLSKYKKKRHEFSGIIGDRKFTKNLDQNTTYAGLRIWCDTIVGGIMSIKRIGLLFDRAESFPVYVYDSNSDQILASYQVACNANTLTWFDIPLPLNLDMSNPESQYDPNYYLIYPVTAKKPKDIVGGCGCGPDIYRYYWSSRQPIFKSFAKAYWSEYIMLTGIIGDVINLDGVNFGRQNWGTTNYLQGIVLDAQFKCKLGELICKEELDFETNDIAMGLAATIRYKAGFYLIEKILASAEINRFTMTDRERLMGKKNTYVKDYQNGLQWLINKINWKANDCLTCDDFDDVIKAGILS